MLGYILIAVGLIGLIAGSLFDLKTREVPDWLSYFLISSGLGLRLIYSIFEMKISYILYGLIGFGTYFLFALIMYYTRQWGGGDAKLLMGLGALFGDYPINGFFNPNLDFPFLLTLIINIILIGGLYGILWAFYLGIKYWSKTKKELKKFNLKFLKIFIILVLLSFFVLLYNFDLFLVIFLILIFSILIIFSMIFIKSVEKCCMYKDVNVNKLTEGDWVANDIKYNGKIICKKKSYGLTNKQINLLKKYKFKRILIKEGIPFVPSFLAGFIITIIWGNIFIIF